MVNALPRTFFKASLVIPISLSQNPPNQGALLGMNFHSTPVLAKASVSVVEENRVVSSSEADRNVEALSERTRYGRDLLPPKYLKTCRKHSTVSLSALHDSRHM